MENSHLPAEADIGIYYRKAKSFEYACGDTEYHYQKVMDNLLK